MKSIANLDSTPKFRIDGLLIRAIVLGVVAIGVSVFAVTQTKVGFGIATRGLAVILIGLFPGAVLLFSRKRTSYPLFAMNCAFYSFAFGYGSFQVFKDIRYSVPESVTEQALDCLIAGLSLMVLSYFALIFFLRSQRSIGFTTDLTPGSLSAMGWLLLLSRLSAMLVPSVTQIPSVGQFLLLADTLGNALLYSMFITNKLPKIQAVAFFGAIVPLECLTRISSGSIAQLMIYCMMFVILRWSLRRKISWVFIVIVIFGYAVFAPLKMQFRYATWNPEEKSFTMPEKMALYFELVNLHWIQGKELISEEDIQQSGDRFNHMPLYGLVVNETPLEVPYWNGETLSNATTAFIPRFLWPDKPTEYLGNVFGHRYGILHPTDESTALNMPWVIELYANFGLFGLLFGMPVFGLLFAYIERLGGNEWNSPYERVFLIALTLSLTYPESNITLMWGGIGLYGLTMYGICFIFRAMNLVVLNKFQK